MASLQCHGLSHLAAARGRLLQPGEAQAELLEAGGIRRAIASLRGGLTSSPERSSRLGRPRDWLARRSGEEVATRGRSGAIAFMTAAPTEHVIAPPH
jgi:hypothetical protein